MSGISGLHSRKEVQRRRIDFLFSFNDIISEILAHSYVLVIFAHFVNVLSIDSTHDSQSLLTSLNSILRNLLTMAEIFTHQKGQLVGYFLIGQHC